MSDYSLTRLGRWAAALGAVFGLGGFVLGKTVGGYAGIGLEDGTLISLMFAVFMGSMVWLVIPNQPRNGAVWSIAVTGFGSGLYLGSFGLAALLAPDPSLLLGDGYIPAMVPAAIAVLVMLSTAVVYVALFAWITFGFALFPDGKWLSPRWRWIGVLTVAGLLLMVIGAFIEYRPANTQPPSEDTVLANIGAALAALAMLLALISLLLRFRTSTGEERLRLKLVVWGAAVTVPAFFIAVMISETRYEPVGIALANVGAAVALIAYGAAIAKYRLYDVDVVISRTLVYGSLAIFITLVYVGVVVGGSVLLGGGEEPSLWLGIAATVVIAIAFQPLRRRVQRMANRLVFGRRATPYEVLSNFSQRIDAVDPGVLKTVARSLAEGTAAAEVGIWMASDRHLQLGATWPGDAALPDDPRRGVDRTWEIVHDGELLGYVGTRLQPGQALSPHDEELVEQVTAGLGLALRNLQLTADLETRVDQLRESRRRIVSAQDQTRRRLERDLHDGAQQRLVALKIKLGIAASMAESGHLDGVKQILDGVKEEADLTIDSLRTLARGIYPPLLEAEGLGPTLGAQLQRISVPVTVQAAGVGRHPRDVEATVYFCVLEAVQNSVRHAQARSIVVTVSDQDEFLTFEVRDDGVGFDDANTTDGPGLTNMADRLDALGGLLEVESTPGRGTRIEGRVPVREEVPA